MQISSSAADVPISDDPIVEARFEKKRCPGRLCIWPVAA